jgi:iron complex outermembrane recepter protein
VSNFKIRVFVAASTAAIPLFAFPVVAQQASSQQTATATPPESTGLAEIVVTAERKEENILSVPLSVQALGGDQLNNESIQSFTNLGLTVPGFSASSGSGFTEIYMRGIGNGVVSGADPSVATFIDDVPRIWGSSNDSLLNVERVEVLKGAQGGLYGRNATGGVINVITRKPTTDGFSGDALIDYGEDATFRAAGFVNLPVNDNIAFNLSYERDSHNAYISNNVPNDPYTPAMFPAMTSIGTAAQTAAFLNSTVFHRPADQRDFWATDDKMLVKMGDQFKITFAGDFSNKADTVGNANVKLRPAFTQGVDQFLLSEFGIPANLPPGFEQSGGGKFAVSEGDNLTNQIREYGGSATMVWNAPGVDLTSITAYRRDETYFVAGVFGSTAPVISAIINNSRHFWYQELRGSSTWDGPLHLIGGATFLYSDFEGTSNIDSLVNYRQPAFIAPPAAVVGDGVHNWSTYLQASYDLPYDLNLTASGRYVHEANDALFLKPTETGISTTEHKFLPSATLSYKLDDGTVYARYARGFKAGGINPSAAPIYFPNPNEGSIFGPELVDTYEIGYRQGLLDHRMQLTTSVFYNRLQGGQFADSGQAAYASTITIAYVNGRLARTYGGEETFSWRVLDPLTIGVSGGLLSAKYLDTKVVNNPVLANINLDGQQMINAPKEQVAITADLDQPITDKLDLVGHFLESYNSKVVFAYSAVPGVLPDADGPAYFLTNLRVGVETHDHKYGLSVYANNLLNRGYFVFGTTSSGTTQLAWGDPRVIGGEFTAKF